MLGTLGGQGYGPSCQRRRSVRRGRFRHLQRGILVVDPVTSAVLQLAILLCLLTFWRHGYAAKIGTKRAAEGTRVCRRVQLRDCTLARRGGS